jgi:hypothetical protein
MGKVAKYATMNRSTTEMKLYAVRSTHPNSARRQGRNWPCGSAGFTARSPWPTRTRGRLLEGEQPGRVVLDLPLHRRLVCPESLHRTRIAATVQAPQEVRNAPLSPAPGRSPPCRRACPGTGGRSPAPRGSPPAAAPAHRRQTSMTNAR